MDAASDSADYDLAIIGGGINGCGIARDAAGRGCRCSLCEQGDLASGTSSASTKLIHGGLRYLEYYEFRLVREALMEREVLLGHRAAHHLAAALRAAASSAACGPPGCCGSACSSTTISAAANACRPRARWICAATGRRVCCKPEFHAASNIPIAGSTMRASWCSMRATRRSAGRRSRRAPPAFGATRDGGLWRVALRDETTAQHRTIGAKALVNAAGPWVAEVPAIGHRRRCAGRVRLVQGSHIVVRRLYDHDRCYIFQNADGRIFFLIPYERDFTLSARPTRTSPAIRPTCARARRRSPISAMRPAPICGRP